jgi:hypothetical protein
MNTYVESFHAHLRNRSALMCIGNGMDWKGMDWSGGRGETPIHSSGSVTREQRIGWMGVQR